MQNFVKMIVTRSLLSKKSIEKKYLSPRVNETKVMQALSKIKKTESGPDNCPIGNIEQAEFLVPLGVTFYAGQWRIYITY